MTYCLSLSLFVALLQFVFGFMSGDTGFDAMVAQLKADGYTALRLPPRLPFVYAHGLLQAVYRYNYQVGAFMNYSRSEENKQDMSMDKGATGDLGQVRPLVFLCVISYACPNEWCFMSHPGYSVFGQGDGRYTHWSH